MRRWIAAVSMVLALGACGGETAPTNAAPAAATASPSHTSAATAAGDDAQVPMPHARTFTVTQRDGYRIVDLRASIVTWGGPAEGPEQHVRLVLVPQGATPPALVGDLADATLIRTPVQRIATNYAPFEAMAVALGVKDRIVAVGGVKSWDDELREATRAGRIAQIGYGWHSPPELDAVLAARPDILFMSMGDLSHTQHMDRLRALGIAVLPAFVDAEPTYLGKVDYVRLFGMLVGREDEANAFADDVIARVDALKAAAAAQPTRRVVSAWFAGGDRWMATVRNADAQMLRDANALNLLEQPDDPRQDAFVRIGTEQLLRQAVDADCWIARDSHSVPYPQRDTLQLFKAYRDGCMFAADGMTKPEADAFDLYETAVIRPDLLLQDLVGMLHPPLRTEPFRYIRPDTQVAQ